MKTIKAAKRERRAHRKAKDHDRRDDGLQVRALGGTMPADLMEQIRSAMTQLDPLAPWPEIAPMVLPVLKRLRHPYPPEASPIHIQCHQASRPASGSTSGRPSATSIGA
ncbi:MAG: hypothetical protein ACSLFN_13450 [Candidatus Limnocylindrales bacterium]